MRPFTLGDLIFAVIIGLVKSDFCPQNLTLNIVAQSETNTYCESVENGTCSKYTNITENVVETVTKEVWVCCDGYTGKNCRQSVCYGNLSCENGGTCVSPNVCSCSSVYTGMKCEQAVCYGETSCKNGGTCVAPDRCSCPQGYTGEKCEQGLLVVSSKGTRITLALMAIAVELLSLLYIVFV